MRTAHEYRPCFYDATDRDWRGDRLGVVLPMAGPAIESPRRKARSEIRADVPTVSGQGSEGALSRFRNMLRIFKRVDDLEARMDGMAEWMEGRK